MINQVLVVLTRIIMITASLTSVFNIHLFFYSVGHSDLVAWTLGITLGVMVALLAMQLAMVKFDICDHKVQILLLTNVSALCISGGIQTATYLKYLPLGYAIPLGFGVPLTAEILLALSESSFRMISEQNLVSYYLNENLTQQTLKYVDQYEIDPALLSGYVDNSLKEFLQINIVSETSKGSKLNSQLLKETRRNKIQDLLKESDTGFTVRQIFYMLNNSCEFSSTERTILNDMKSLLEQGSVTAMGKKKNVKYLSNHVQV